MARMQGPIVSGCTVRGAHVRKSFSEGFSRKAKPALNAIHKRSAHGAKLRQVHDIWLSKA